MKRLTIITDNFQPRKDGITRFLTEIIPRLQSDYKITVVCPDFGPSDVDGVRLVKIPLTSYSAGDFTFARLAPKTIYKELKKADIIFSQTIGPVGGLGLFLAKFMRRKTVSFIHSIEWDLFSKATTNKWVKKYGPALTRRWVSFLYNSCKHLIIPSKRIAELVTWEGVKTPKTIIHLGVDTKKFAKKDALALRERLGIKPKDVVVGYHGRIAREKDLATFLRAFVKLRKTHENLKILILGSGVQQIITRIKKQPGVIYIPAQDDVEEYLSAMDIYCLPSLTETTSLSTLEAMSSSLPVVTTPVGFVKDYVKDGVNGYFFKSGDSYDLAKKLDLLLKNKRDWKRLGENGRKLVVKNFDWDLTATELIKFFSANMQK